MQHEDAMRTHAAERYLLGEMTPDERELYEEHYFSCDRCGQELSVTVAFLDNARGVLRPGGEPAGVSPLARVGEQRSIRQPREEDRERWWQRLFDVHPQRLTPALGLAVVLLLSVVGYQQLLVIPGLRQQLASRDAAQGVPAVALRSAARGAGPRLVIGPTDTYAVLQADLFSERPVQRYAAAILSADGRERFSTTLAAPEAGVPVTLLVPVRDLATGDYTLVIHELDATGREAGRFGFSLQRQ
jgi:hypothetical protein